MHDSFDDTIDEGDNKPHVHTAHSFFFSSIVI